MGMPNFLINALILLINVTAYNTYFNNILHNYNLEVIKIFENIKIFEYIIA